VKNLSRRKFFYTIHWASLNTEATESTAPGVDKILLTICDNGMLWADEPAIIATNAESSNFKLDLSHGSIIGKN
jgi:hypothetical protein